MHMTHWMGRSLMDALLAWNGLASPEGIVGGIGEGVGAGAGKL